MKLSTFIAENMEAILKGWEDFARELWPDANPGIWDLRDHAEEMLLTIVSDMQTPESEVQRHDKSVGKLQPSEASELVIRASARHSVSRLNAGFDIRALVAEYRALRACVLQLWSQAEPDMAATQCIDMLRFNECVDQLLTESVMIYSERIEYHRELFLAILGHDLKSPLCAVSMMAGLLEEKGELGDSTRQMASQIVISAREMSRLVTDLLEFAGAHMGMKMPVTRQPVNLEELCREVMEEVAAVHRSRVFDLETNGDGYGEWDRARLRQLISNLLSNAVQHGAGKTPIRLFLKEEGDAVMLGVCNQGPPIPPAKQEVIFDPLSRCSAGGCSLESGSLGLGLYIAREVVRAHDGDIEVSSDDRETTFIARLPRRNLFGKQHR